MNMVNRYSALSWLMAGMLPAMLNATEELALKPATPESMSKAAQLAARVLEKTGDAGGAVKVFEEAGILGILQAKPADFPLEVYTDVLLNYARILFQIQERYHEAEPVVLQVLKFSPEQYPAYLLAADIKQRRYHATKEPAYAQQAKQYYRQYIDALSARKLQTVLPDRVVNAVYDAENLDVCTFVKQLLSEKQDHVLYHLLKAETHFEKMKRDEKGILFTIEPGITFKEFADADMGVVYRSRVDIDNDESTEVRYWKKLQSNGCMRNLFYKKEAGKSRLVTNALLDSFFKAERLCGESNLEFLRFKSTNYFLEKRVLDLEALKYAVHYMDSGNSPQTLCTFDMQTPVSANITSECDAAVCKKIIVLSEAIIAANGERGIERRFDRSEPLRFDDSVMKENSLASYLLSPHVSFADLDNDAEDEMIIRLWEKPVENSPPRFSYRLFERINSHWKWRPFPVKLSTYINGSVLDDKTWFFVESHEGKNYIVTYKVFQKIQDELEQLVYEMSIYYLQGEELQALGRIEVLGQ